MDSIKETCLTVPVYVRCIRLADVDDEKWQPADEEEQQNHAQHGGRLPLLAHTDLLHLHHELHHRLRGAHPLPLPTHHDVIRAVTSSSRGGDIEGV